MNHKSTYLQSLINALKGGEKRYFQHFTKSFTAADENPIYLQLFGLLVKGKNEIQNKLKGNSPQTLTIAKKQLYGNILKSLRLFHSEKSANIKVQNLLADIENLYNLGLAEQALIPLKQAFGIVYQQEKFGYLLQVLDWEKRLNIVLEKATRPSEEIKAEEEKVIRQLSQIKLLEGLYGKIMSFKKKHGFVKGSVRDTLEFETVSSIEMPKLEDCLSMKAVYYYNFIHAIYHWMIFEHTESSAYSSKLLEENSAILPNDFINGILQHITSSVCLARFEDTLNGILFAEAYIEQYRLNQSAAFSTLVFAYHATYGLVVHLYKGSKEQMAEMIQYVTGGLETFEKSIQLDMKQIILGNLLVAYMAINDYTMVDKIWNTLFNNPQSKQIRQDVYADLYLFRLFRLLHEKRYELLQSAALSAQRFFKKSDSFAEVELPIASMLIKERQYEHHEILREVLEAAKMTIENFIQQTHGVDGFQEHYTRYIIWCDAILNDEPYYVAAKKWYEEFGIDGKCKQLI